MKETEEKAIAELKTQGKIIHDIDGEKSIKEIQKTVDEILG